MDEIQEFAPLDFGHGIVWLACRPRWVRECFVGDGVVLILGFLLVRDTIIGNTERALGFEVDW